MTTTTGPAPASAAAPANLFAANLSAVAPVSHGTGPFVQAAAPAVPAASSGQPSAPFAANPFSGFSKFARQAPQAVTPGGVKQNVFAQQQTYPAKHTTNMAQHNSFAAAAAGTPKITNTFPGAVPPPQQQQQQNPFVNSVPAAHAPPTQQNPFAKAAQPQPAAQWPPAAAQSQPLFQLKASPQPTPQPLQQPTPAQIQFAKAPPAAVQAQQKPPVLMFQPPVPQPQPQQQAPASFQFSKAPLAQPAAVQAQQQAPVPFQFSKAPLAQPAAVQTQPQPQPQLFKFPPPTGTAGLQTPQQAPANTNPIFPPPPAPTPVATAGAAQASQQVDEGRVETLAQLAPGMDRECLRDLLRTFNNDLGRAAEKLADLIPKEEVKPQAQPPDMLKSRQSQTKDQPRWRDLSDMSFIPSSTALSRGGPVPCRDIKPRHTRSRVSVSSHSLAAPRQAQVSCNRLEISDACKPQLLDEKVKCSKWMAVDNPGAPVLTKRGYFTVPALRDLQSMSQESLSQVQGFEVHREGFGSIVWEDNVDLRHIDLDKVVRIDQNYVSVYETPESAPDVGMGLNRPAVVTLVNVKPKQNEMMEEPTQEEIEKFTRKIEKATRRCGAKLLGYSVQKGEWRMRVPAWSVA